MKCLPVNRLRSRSSLPHSLLPKYIIISPSEEEESISNIARKVVCWIGLRKKLKTCSCRYINNSLFQRFFVPIPLFPTPFLYFPVINFRTYHLIRGKEGYQAWPGVLGIWYLQPFYRDANLWRSKIWRFFFYNTLASNWHIKERK